MDGAESSRKAIISRLEQFHLSFLIQEYYGMGKYVGKIESQKKSKDVFIDFISVFIGNRSFSDTSVLDAYVKVFTENREKAQLVQMTSLKDGSFTCRGVQYTVPKWKTFVKQAKELATFAGEVQLLKVGMTFKGDRILFSYISSTPEISRQFVPNVKLRKFFMQMVTERKFAEANRPKENKKSRKEFKRWQKIQTRLVEKGKLRKGIRTYMFLIWKNSIIDDLLHTRGYSLSKKIWAWKRGFLSFRIQQYGLTEENYKEYLSDLDYHWLNRINNYTQKWVNDKTTFRYAMESLKEHAPEYYFLVMHRGNRTCVKKMIDAPEYADCSIKSILEVLKDKKELAFKPSAGTHGDGFYKLEYVDGQYHVNGKETSQEDLIKVLNSQKSYYVVTDFLHLADDLAKIYPKSLNTIRMMTINENVHEPKIMHAYMRVGAASSGFTDNVGYGGIAVRIDLETGHYYGGEQIVNHCFSDCDVHPDTGVEIDGMIPHWDEVKEGILGFCKAFPELEYLGFDVAVTEESYKILEVNIHQDLHKYAEQSPEVKAYFARKKQLKAGK